MIALVAAVGKNRVIGKDNVLLWHIPEDLKHFKELTTGHPVIMGRKTWESIPEKFRPLPARSNIVVTRDMTYQAPGAEVAHSLPAAIEKAKTRDGSGEIFIMGGGQLYAQALPFADRLYLTVVDDEKEGGVYFPEYETLFTKITSDEARESAGFKYHWRTLERE